VFVISMAWFEGELMLYHVYCILYILLFFLHFLHIHLSHFASPVILACVYLIMLTTVLG
jgi:hypothetical protein